MTSTTSLGPAAALHEPLTAPLKATDTDTAPAGLGGLQSWRSASLARMVRSMHFTALVCGILALGCLALLSPRWRTPASLPSTKPSHASGAASPLVDPPRGGAGADTGPTRMMTPPIFLAAGDGVAPRSKNKKEMARVYTAFGKVELPGEDFKPYLADNFAWAINVVETGKRVHFATKDAAFDALNTVLAAITMPDQNYTQETIRIDEEAKVVVLAWQAKDFGSSTDINFFDENYKLRFLETNMASCPVELCK